MLAPPPILFVRTSIDTDVRPLEGQVQERHVLVVERLELVVDLLAPLAAVPATGGGRRR